MQSVHTHAHKYSDSVACAHPFMRTATDLVMNDGQCLATNTDVEGKMRCKNWYCHIYFKYPFHLIIEVSIVQLSEIEMLMVCALSVKDRERREDWVRENDRNYKWEEADHGLEWMVYRFHVSNSYTSYLFWACAKKKEISVIVERKTGYYKIFKSKWNGKIW